MSPCKLYPVAILLHLRKIDELLHLLQELMNTHTIELYFKKFRRTGDRSTRF